MTLKPGNANVNLAISEKGAKGLAKPDITDRTAKSRVSAGTFAITRRESVIFVLPEQPAKTVIKFVLLANLVRIALFPASVITEANVTPKTANASVRMGGVGPPVCKETEESEC